MLTSVQLWGQNTKRSGSKIHLIFCCNHWDLWGHQDQICFVPQSQKQTGRICIQAFKHQIFGTNSETCRTAPTLTSFRMRLKSLVVAAADHYCMLLCDFFSTLFRLSFKDRFWFPRVRTFYFLNVFINIFLLLLCTCYVFVYCCFGFPAAELCRTNKAAFPGST